MPNEGVMFIAGENDVTKSKEIMELDKEYYQQGYARVPIVIVEGKGAVLKDIEGNEYIDCFAGISTANAGHAPDALIEAGTEQMKKLFHVSGRFHTVPQVKLAKKLSEITPGNLNKTFLCNSGTEAVENAVKLVKKYAFVRGLTGGAMISLECAFHGRLGVSFSLTANASYKKGFGSYSNSPGVKHAPTPYSYRSKFSEEECGTEAANRLEEVIDRHTTGDVAAFIMEPILGEGGIIIPPDCYFTEILKILKEREIPFIVDEVQTGFGRTGKLLASEHWGLKPEVMTLAKGMGGGIPIGACIGTDKIAAKLESGDFFSTYGGNPVTSAISLANINYIQEAGLIENSVKIGKVFMDGLEDIQKKRALIGDVRGKGLMIGIELVKDQSSKEPAKDEAKRFVELIKNAGVLIGLGGIFKNVLRLQPPLVISEEQAKTVLDKMNNVFAGL
ncbi:MAG: aspartate aminotransferase family protein [Candidatus Thorarchaeota archaeon]|nr:MAG: aspartate aminotransferase family protein [Candidatus Thorarchaeota archaeon]